MIGKKTDLGSYFAFAGMEPSKDGLMISTYGYESAVNVEIRKGFPSTRRGVSVVPIIGDEEDVNNWSAENHQGSKIHNPSRGQSAKVFANDRDLIMSAVGGRKFSLKPKRSASGEMYAEIEDLTSGLRTDPSIHLVYWGTSIEIYAMANDGFSDMWIWDSSGPAFNQVGYLPNDKPNSKLPNGGTVIGYAHGRVHIATNRVWISGDGLHKNSLTTPINLLDATEQTYWDTGKAIVPPSAMGDPLAFAPIPRNRTVHGIGDSILYHQYGAFGVDYNKVRSSWADEPMTEHVLLYGSARGPYAVDIMDGDHIFRSNRSLELLTSVLNESEPDGNPENTIGQEIKDLLALDYEPYLRFASVVTWHKRNRALCTIDPVVRNRFWHHRALVSKNFKPRETERSPHATESMFTFPPEIRNICQLVRGHVGHKEEIFFVSRNDTYDPRDGQNKLVIFDELKNHDLVYDFRGLKKKYNIESQLVTKKLSMGESFTSKKDIVGRIGFKDVESTTKYAVYYKTDKSKCWSFWYKGCLEFTPKSSTVNFTGLNAEDPEIVLPKVRGIGKFKWIQCKIIWEGSATLWYMLVNSAVEDSPDWSFKTERKCIDITHACCCDEDFYSYSRWSDHKPFDWRKDNNYG